MGEPDEVEKCYHGKTEDEACHRCNVNGCPWDSGDSCTCDE